MPAMNVDIEDRNKYDRKGPPVGTLSRRSDVRFVGHEGEPEVL